MSKLNIQKASGALVIDYDWRIKGLWFLVIFSVIWNLGIFGALIGGAGIFVIIHLLIGLFMGYYTITRFINKTTITVSRQSLKMEHGPLPWPFSKERDIPARALVQLYVEKSSTRVNEQTTYNLVAKLDTGARVKLIRSDMDKDHLLQLETTIEAYLDIQNDTSLGITGDSDHSILDLEQMREQMEKLEPIKKWLPKSILTKMEEAESRMTEEANRRRGVATRPADSPDVSIDLPAGSPRPLEPTSHNFGFPLYRAQQGDQLTYRKVTYSIGRTAQLDFEDDNIPTGRQLELVPSSGGQPIHFYAQTERGRWSYFEERRLDDDEVITLGFTGTNHPLRFDNGDDRYYPRDEQRGNRFFAVGGSQSVQQFIYFTTGSNTQFRSLQPAGGSWEVYVMEPVDISFFAE